MCWIDPPSKFYRQIFDLDGENSVQVFDSIDDGRQLEYWLLFWEAGDAKNHWDDGTSCEKQSVPVVSEQTGQRQRPTQLKLRTFLLRISIAFASYTTDVDSLGSSRSREGNSPR